MTTKEKNVKFTTADEFYEENLIAQREAIQKHIDVSKSNGDPVIMLPFDTYPIVEKEMTEAGWVYESYLNSENKKCALFYPKKY